MQLRARYCTTHHFSIQSRLVSCSLLTTVVHVYNFCIEWNEATSIKSVYVKLPKKKTSGWIETPDRVEPWRRVNSNHHNIEQYFIVMTMPSSLIQCPLTASFHVRFQLSHSVEVGVYRSTTVSDVALDSHKLGICQVNVVREENGVAVRRLVIVVPDHLRAVKCWLRTTTRRYVRSRVTR